MTAGAIDEALVRATGGPPTDGRADRALDAVFRSEHGRVLAVLLAEFRDFDLAEDALGDAVGAAVGSWRRDGVPSSPGAWLLTVARRRAIDRLRRTVVARRRLPELLVDGADASGAGDPAVVSDGSAIPDERLRLIFTCCHPALAVEARVALTLRVVAGLTTEEVASAFLVTPVAMSRRITRAKRKIQDAGIPYRVPPVEVLPERLDAVLSVLYLIFNEGYKGSDGERLQRPDLVREAIGLARVLAQLMPDEPEVAGILALFLLHDARRDARTDGRGDLVRLEDQDRSRWDRAAIVEGTGLLERALRRGRPGPYQIQAAIAAVHDEAPTAEATDWLQIAALYGELLVRTPTPIVRLNHAVAVAMARGPDRGLALVDALGRELGGHHLWHATRAELLRRLGRLEQAGEAYDAAIEAVRNEPERRHLVRRRRTLGVEA